MQSNWYAQPRPTNQPPKKSAFRFLPIALLLLALCLILGCVAVYILDSTATDTATPTAQPTAIAQSRPTSTPARSAPSAQPTEPALGVIERGIPRETGLEASIAQPTLAPTATSRSVNTDGVRRSGLVVRNVTIYDLNGKVAYKGDMDLKPTLDRIEAGRRDPHPNDGTNYTNRERRLPYKTDSQYYTEYVVRTPGLKDVGPQRLVIGKGSEIYYTADHYVTFITITR